MNELIKYAFKEDIPNVDITTQSLNVTNRFGQAKLHAKQDLTLSGCDLFENSLHHIDPELSIHWHFHNGDDVLQGQVCAQIDGNLVKLIQAERVALNFLGYLSGIATQTRAFVKACDGTNTKILDTRKTLPHYREFAKEAVVHGGGTNHRMGLSDMIMIKENHVILAGGFRRAIELVKKQDGFKIEVEATNINEVKEAVSQQVDQIMLDNMSNDEMAEALKHIPKTIMTEASGNMTLDRIPSVAALGVDYISVGALTHSVKNADLSLLFEWE